MHILTSFLLEWFAREQRDLPWRVDYAPYAVWVSEMMLQQTQMERGVAYFTRWMERFPTLEAVAEAEEAELLKAWEGLGYYRRVRQMQEAARKVVKEYSGQFPAETALLRELPGVGEYTAAAIASIAFQRDVLCVDANVERVFARLYNISGSVRKTENAALLREKANALLPEGQAREFNQALMELGALVCGKSPHCEVCPLEKACEARGLGVERERPEPVPRKKSIALRMSCGIFQHEGRILLHKRPDKGLWAGLWEFPTVDCQNRDARESLEEYLRESGIEGHVRHEFGEKRHSYTCYRVRLYAFLLDSIECTPEHFAEPEWRWVRPEELAHYTFSAGQRRLLEDLRASISLLK